MEHLVGGPAEPPSPRSPIKVMVFDAGCDSDESYSSELYAANLFGYSSSWAVYLSGLLVQECLRHNEVSDKDDGWV